jgi:hypothetical protein
VITFSAANVETRGDPTMTPEKLEKLMDALSQGLTLVHFSAQLEPCLTQENTLHTLNTP